jgi:hypothetical protein
MPLPLYEVEMEASGDKAANYTRDKYSATIGMTRNGYQWSSIPVDREMLIVLQSIIAKALEDPGLT